VTIKEKIKDLQICSVKTYLTYKTALSTIANWMTSNLLCLNSLKTEFLSLGLLSQLNKIHSPTLHLNSGISLPPTASDWNLGFIFDSNLTLSDQVSAISRTRFYHIRDLCRIRPVLDFSTAHATGTSLVHSKLDYCNSLYLNLPKTQLNRLQHIQNSLTRAVVAAPRLIIFSNLFTGSKFRNVMNIILFPLLIRFSSFQANRTFMTPSPYRLHVLLGHQTWSLSSVPPFSHVSG